MSLPLPYMGGVNVWLLRGDPLTLVDTGPATDAALSSLEEQLIGHGTAIEELELVVLTHHHLDHTGLATHIKERSGATIAAHRSTAAYGAQFHEGVDDERRFTLDLIAAHGVPDDVIANSGPFFEQIITQSRSFDTDQVVVDGGTIRAGGRTLRAVHRPGHSISDTLWVDDETDDAFVGDHLLANITSAVELGPTELPGDERRRGLMEYLGNLRKTQVMPLRTCFAGHGPLIDNHARLIDKRIAFHADRLDRIRELVGGGCHTAFAVAQRLWSVETATESPVLVVWEVLGHLDLLANRGLVREELGAGGEHSYHLRERN